MTTARLKGQFIECCDCYTVCPCWIAEKADEGHCTGLYAWVFSDAAEIDGVSLKNRVVAAASYHGRRRVTQTVLFMDTGLTAGQRRALSRIFTAGDDEAAGESDQRFAALHSLLGDIVAEISATITARRMDGNWSITVKSGDQTLANAEGVDRVVNGLAAPVTLRDTALQREMGVDGAVRVQDMERLEIAVAALPGEPFVYVGRAGMAGRFDYGQ